MTTTIMLSELVEAKTEGGDVGQQSWIQMYLKFMSATNLLATLGGTEYITGAQKSQVGVLVSMLLF